MVRHGIVRVVVYMTVHEGGSAFATGTRAVSVLKLALVGEYHVCGSCLIQALQGLPLNPG